MTTSNGLNLDLATVGHLVGDVARASMLAALIEGRAFTAGELAFHAGISPQTASAHLAKLVDGGLLGRLRQGRHHYFRLASPSVARMLEAMAIVAAVDAPQRRRRLSPRDEQLRYARSCYDHLAGALSVAIANALMARGAIEFTDDGGIVTAAGRALFDRLGIPLASLETHRRCLLRPCLDWTERRPHLAGALGAALMKRLLELGWLERRRDSRAISVAAAGESGLVAMFGLDVRAMATRDRSLARSG